ncbi:hypothetical protein KL935_001728 [Ogataea polymorpha]|nr:hypothetical protein KL935_001728 [Ogataea polymorpha]KAG7910802.1 hypothetical protein KL906_001182 [Ogataea polymorpha]
MSKKAKYVSNIDTGVLQQFSGYLDVLDKKEEPTPESLQSFSSFLASSQNLNALVQAFSYYSTVNDHSGLSQILQKLVRLIRLGISYQELHKPCSTLIQDILSTHNIKIFYRCLNNQKGGITNPALRLLSSSLEFRKGAYVDLFLDNFDLSLKVLPQLLVPIKSEMEDPSKCKTKSSIRSNFILFWVSLCTQANPLTRKDLLFNNRKIITNWIKYMATHDSYDTIRQTLTFLDKYIIEERSYKKMTKCKIFGDYIPKKLLELYGVEAVRDEVHEFLTKLAKDHEVGLVFSDDRNMTDTTGASVTIGDHTFKIHNKLIFSLIASCKPWTDLKQLDLIVSVLSAVPELVPCYNYNLGQTIGVHDPKLSALYIAESLLLTKIIRLPVAEKVLESNSPASLVVEYICPNSLRRTSFSKALSTDIGLVRHIGSQLLVDVLQKLQKSYPFMNPDVRNEVLEILINQRLPDFSLIIGALNDCYKSEPYNKLLIVNLLKACEYYQAVLNQCVPMTLPKINIGQENEFKAIDLTILESYLKFNSDSQQSKWFNAGTAKNSLFTTILRLPYRLKEAHMRTKVVGVISNLIDSSLSFVDCRQENSILITQAYALVYALDQFSRYVKNEEDIDAICKTLDEAISRVMRTPYRYIDITRDFGKPMSPFYVAAIEQAKFATTDSVKVWVNLLTRYMFLIGEPLDSMKKVLLKYWSDDQLEFDNFESSLKEFCSLFYGDEEVSFFEMVVNYPVSKLKKAVSTKVAMSDIDAIGLLRRLQLLASDETMRLADIESIVVELFSKLANYLAQRTSSQYDAFDQVDLFKTKYWSPLYVNGVHSEKQYFVAGLLNEMFYSLFELDHSIRARLTDYENYVHNFKSPVMEEQQILASSLWVLDDSKLLGHLFDPTIIQSKVLELAALRDVEVDANDLTKVADFVTETSLHFYVKLVSRTNFEEFQIITLAQKAQQNELVYSALSAILRSNADIARILLTNRGPAINSSVHGLNYLITLNEHAQSESLRLELENIAAEKLQDFLSTSTASNVPIYVKLLAGSASSDLFARLMEFPPFYNNAAYIFSPESAYYVSQSVDNVDLLKQWCSKAILYSTKMFAEKDTLPEKFLTFISSLKELLLKIDIWTIVPPSILNSHLEVLFSEQWIRSEDILHYVSWLLMTTTSKTIQHSKHVQLFINNKFNVLNELPSKSNLSARFYSTIILYYLVQVGPVSNFDVAKRILQFYSGSLRADDLILKHILMEIEQHVGQSWLAFVADWEFLDADSYESSTTRFITSSAHGLIVNLSKKFINNSIARFSGSCNDFSLPAAKKPTWQDWEDFLGHNSVILEHAVISDIYERTIYDPEFIMLLIVNNDELFKTQQDYVAVDVRRLVETDILQFIVMNMSNCNEEVRHISRKILQSCYLTIDTELKQLTELKEDKAKTKGSADRAKTDVGTLHLFSFKDRLTFKVYLGNLLSTKEECSPVITIMLSHLIPVLNNPGHYLYEKAYRYILGGSKFRPFDIPLLKAVTQHFVADKHLGHSRFDENYYKQLSWVISTLTKSLSHQDDLKVINRSGILEYLMALTGSPFLSFKHQQEIVHLLHKIAELPNGADLLIRSYGVLSFTEIQRLRLSTDTVSSNFQLLDWQRFAVKAHVTADKRAYEWTSDDLNRSVKRVLT